MGETGATVNSKGGTTEQTIPRKSLGGDNSISEHIIERDAEGNALSKTHRVTSPEGASNTPISSIDIDGLEAKNVITGKENSLAEEQAFDARMKVEAKQEAVMFQKSW
jgi:hypothetical protein